MRILAIDTSERQFSLCALQGDQVIDEFVFELPAPATLTCEESASDGSTSHQSLKAVSPTGVAVELFPEIEKMFQRCGWRMADVEMIAVAQGPGSFTGLRTGIVAAKTLAYANQVPLVAVNTLEAMALRVQRYLHSGGPESIGIVDWQPGTKSLTVQCVINAQRQQLFVGKFQIGKNERRIGEIHEPIPSRIMGREEWLSQLTNGNWVTGSGLKPLSRELAALRVAIAPEFLWLPSAGAIGQLGWRDYQAGKTSDMWRLEPFYFRPSYAEEQ